MAQHQETFWKLILIPFSLVLGWLFYQKFFNVNLLPKSRINRTLKSRKINIVNLGGLTRLELSRKSLSFNSNFETFLISQESPLNFFSLFGFNLKLKGVLVLKVDSFKRQNSLARDFLRMAAYPATSSTVRCTKNCALLVAH